MSDNFFKVNKGVSLVPQGATPSNPSNGDMYYDSTLQKFRKYENGAWSDLDSGGSTSSIQVTLNNNQSTPADITGALISGLENRGFIMDYSISRMHSVTGGVADLSFLNNASVGNKFNAQVNTVIGQPSGRVIVSGSFTNYGGTASRDRLVRLDIDGNVDTNFCNNASDSGKFNGVVYIVASQSDNKSLIGGVFTNYDSVSGRDFLIRLNSDGTTDTTFCANAVDGGKFLGSISAIAIQTDGKILVGGSFIDYDGTSGRDYLVRLNSDGTLDTAFCVNAVDGSKFNDSIYTISVQADGKILVGGAFNTYAGTTDRNHLVRLNSDGTTDTTFCANAVDGIKFSNLVLSVAFQLNGKIVVGGVFTNYAGTIDRNRLIRLNSDGTLDTTFCVNAVDGIKFNNAVNYIVSQNDNKIVVGGAFTNYAGTSGRSRLVRINADGTTDTTFCANAVDGGKINTAVTTIALESDYNILFGGNFITYNSISSANRLVRLNGDNVTSLQSTGTFNGLYRPNSNSWEIGNETYLGDLTGVDFSITSLGQVQYITNDIPGPIVESFIKFVFNKI